MLQIVLPARELYDETTFTFTPIKSERLQLEHSLVSLSKWESKWKKPFLGKVDKTVEETLDYIKCMTITQNVNPDIYNNLTSSVLTEIEDYINDTHTATTFSEDKNQRTSRDIVTSEIIYYWMVAENIPMECQKWHLNKLIALIRVCSIKNQPAKKRGKREALSSRTSLNAARKAKLNTTG